MGCTIASPPKETGPCDYCRDISLYIGYAFCQVCIGATNMMAIIYSVHTSNYHGAFCTIGWQLLIAEGALLMVYTRCNPLKYHHRRSTHMFIQILGMMFIVAGTVLVLYIVGQEEAELETHGIIGIIAFTFSLISALAGPIAALRYEQVKIVHGILSIPTFILSTLTFITGTFTEECKKYLGSGVIVIGAIMLLYYALFFIVSAYFHLTERYRLLTAKPETGWYGSSSKPQRDHSARSKKSDTSKPKATSSKSSTKSAKK